MKFFKIPALFALASAMLAPVVASAAQTIAHRGLFHDVNDAYALPENSLNAVVRAHNMGLNGVELDLRMSSDGTVLVTHDQIANRTTADDWWGGTYNPINGATGGGTPGANWINSQPATHWESTRLKVYGLHGDLLAYGSGASAYMMSLDTMLGNLEASYRDVAYDNNFKIILDIQDPNVLTQAAAVVQVRKYWNNQNNVYLKFFASKALFNQAAYAYNGSDVCYRYAKDHNMHGLNIIPQINDGELGVTGIATSASSDENDDTVIYAFQTALSVHDYLQCWADAQAQHSDAAQMPIVSASVPSDNVWAWNGAGQALDWARQHGRQTMSIASRPDAARWNSSISSCSYYTWQSTDVRAGNFNDSGRASKDSFISGRNPDYIIEDIMGNVGGRSWDGSDNAFHLHLC